MSAKAHGSVAVVFAADGLAFPVGYRAHAQAKGVRQTDQGHELAQLQVAAQVTGLQVEAPAFEVLKALLDGPALGVELPHVRQAHVAKKKEEIPVRQGLDPDLSPDPVDLALGEAPGLSDGQAQVRNGLPAATRVGEQVVPG